MQAYYHFSLNRSKKHLLIAFGVLILPLVSLFVFSFVNGIQFTTAISDLLISTGRLFVAFIFATVIAWLLVVVLIRGKTESAVLALFDVLQSMPTFIILPMAVHFLGQSEFTIIFFLTITIIWPIIFSIVSSLKQIDKSWTEAVKMSRMKGIDYVRYFLLPVTTPGIVTGAIIGLGDGWEALIATELLLHTKTGLGPFFTSFSNNTTMTLFGVLIFLSVIYALNKFIWLPLLEKSHRLIEQ
jgi:ABC-type nitrate/sulfonate/bicarbonate transport system permease component